MTEEKQTVQIDISEYPETCSKCLWPARTELTIDERFGHDWFEYCVNPKCIHFDGTNLQEKRDQLVRQVRQSKTYKRYLKRLWAAEIKRHKSLRKESYVLRQAS